jgi:hypothetical protein
MAPGMPMHNYQTWAIASPPNTHWRPATCEESGCGYHRNGWTTVTDDPEVAEYIRRRSGRQFREEPLPGGMSQFTFTPGQRCFHWRDHRIRLDREEIFLRLEGHHHRYTGERLVHSGPVPWRDEFGERQERLTDAIRRG